jgi:hypothetical protein
MGSKLGSALLAGMFFTFFLDFFFILGIFLNYIEAQDIDVYYNVLFADHQSYLLYALGVVTFGYLFIFFKNIKVAAIIFAVCFALVNLTQIPSIGKEVGEMLLAEKNKVIRIGVHTYIGTIVYKGRDTVWFYDDELEKIITFKKEEISE